MQKYISVLMLIASCSIKKIAAILAIMFTGEMAAYMIIGRNAMYLDSALGYIRIPTGAIIFGAYAGIFFVLTQFGKGRGADPTITLDRLRVSRSSVFAMQIIYNTCMFTIFWGVQVAIYLLMIKLYCTANPDAVGAQSVFMAFVKNTLPHSFLPMAHPVVLIRNIVLVVMMGVVSSCASFEKKYSKQFPALSAAIIFAAAFPADINHWRPAFFFLAMGMTGAVLVSLEQKKVFTKGD